MSRCLVRRAGVSWAIPAIGVAFLFLLSAAPIPARAEEFAPPALAFPHVVAPGDEVSFDLDDSHMLFFAHSEAVDEIAYQYFRNGTEPLRGMQTGFTGAIRLEPGRWNLTFLTGGRIALGFFLGDRCVFSWADVERDRGFTCPPIMVTEAIAFMADSLDSTAAYDYRIDGGVDSHFYGSNLLPLGDGPVARIRGADAPIIVLIPRGGPAMVRVSAAFPRPAVEAVFGGLAVAGGFAAVAVALVWRSRRRRDVITTDDAEGTLK